MISKKHLPWLDMVRTVAMILVVFSHSCDYIIKEIPGYHPFWYSIVTCLITVAVPTYFLISGYLIALRGGEGVRQFKNILISFIIWSVIYFLLHIIIYQVSPANPSFLLNSITGVKHLYFLFALLQIHLLLNFIYSALTKQNIYGVLTIYASITLLIYTISDISSWTSFIESEWIIKEFEGVFCKFGLSWAGFYFLGVFFAFRPTVLNNFSKGAPRLALFSIITFLIYVVEFRLNGNAEGAMTRKYFLLGGLAYQFFGALFLLSFFQTKKEEKRNIYNWLAQEGKYTFGIYLVHPAIIIFLIIIILPIKIINTYTALPLAALLFFGSWVISSVLTRCYGPFITGKFFLKQTVAFTKKMPS